ncbi:MAG: hypothetical protein ACK58B_18360 [Dolichospermum sp.]
MTREQGTGNREQGRSFGQLYFSLLMSVFSVHLLSYKLSEAAENEPQRHREHGGIKV